VAAYQAPQARSKEQEAGSVLLLTVGDEDIVSLTRETFEFIALIVFPITE
jgi:hypothetical protein